MALREVARERAPESTGRIASQEARPVGRAAHRKT